MGKKQLECVWYTLVAGERHSQLIPDEEWEEFLRGARNCLRKKTRCANLIPTEGWYYDGAYPKELVKMYQQGGTQEKEMLARKIVDYLFKVQESILVLVPEEVREDLLAIANHYILTADC